MIRIMKEENMKEEEKNLESDNMSTEDNNVTDNTSVEDGAQNTNNTDTIDWEEKYMQLNDTYLRLNAEFDNYRKRTIKEKSELLKTASEKVIVDVITVVDDFERAIENLVKIENSEATLEGVQLIYSKFLNILTKYSVKEIEAIGHIFDVEKHEAITTVPASKEEDKDKIIDCIQKGYAIGDKVIRFPKVIVAK